MSTLVLHLSKIYLSLPFKPLQALQTLKPFNTFMVNGTFNLSYFQLWFSHSLTPSLELMEINGIFPDHSTQLTPSPLISQVPAIYSLVLYFSPCTPVLSGNNLTQNILKRTFPPAIAETRWTFSIIYWTYFQGSQPNISGLRWYQSRTFSWLGCALLNN